MPALARQRHDQRHQRRAFARRHARGRLVHQQQSRDRPPAPAPARAASGRRRPAPPPAASPRASKSDLLQQCRAAVLRRVPPSGVPDEYSARPAAAASASCAFWLTVIEPKVCATWNVRPIPARVARGGRHADQRLAPRIRSCRRRAQAARRSRLNSVDLPAPLGPISAVTLPAASANDTSSTARTPPNERDTAARSQLAHRDCAARRAQRSRRCPAERRSRAATIVDAEQCSRQYSACRISSVASPW